MDSVDTIQTLIIPALQIRAGDEFDRHRKTWTARHDANRYTQFSVRVETENGGVVYFSVRDEITVRRDTKGLQCSATA